MKHISVTYLTVIGLTAAMLIAPMSVSAFWPFDGGNGTVLGTETSQQGGFFDQLRQFLSRFNITQNTTTTNYGLPSGATGAGTGFPILPTGATGTFRSGDDFPRTGATTSLGTIPNPKARLDAAVQNGKITQAQEDEILSRLAAIRAKQLELMALEKMFADWMKANNLSTSLFGPSPRGPLGGSGTQGYGNGQIQGRPLMMPRPSGYPGSQR